MPLRTATWDACLLCATPWTAVSSSRIILIIIFGKLKRFVVKTYYIYHFTSRICRRRSEIRHGTLQWCMWPFLQWGCPHRIHCCLIMHVHAMGFVVEGQGLIMMDGILNKGSHGTDPSQCVSSCTYVRVCSFFFCFFVTIKVTTRWMPCYYLYVLISIEMYACSLGQLI